MILLSGLSEEESILLEPLFIAYYKQKGMCKANIHNGGSFGGNVFTNLPCDEKEAFVGKMTKINKARCSSDDFKKKNKHPNEAEIRISRRARVAT